MRRAIARVRSLFDDPPQLVIAVVAAAAPVHTTGFGSATSGGAARGVSIPATLPIAEIVERLNDLQAPVLMGYASALAGLRREQKAGRLHITPFATTSTSEALTAEDRTAVTEAFGVPVVDQFASTEGLVGHSEPGETVLTFSCDQCLVELVDEDDLPVPIGEPAAKVLVTNLYNRTQPLIRYELTDRFVRHDDAPDHGHLRATVEGRADQVFRYGTTELHPIVVRSTLVKTPTIVEYQVRQTANGVDVDVVAAGAVDVPVLVDALEAGLGAAGLPDPRGAGPPRRRHPPPPPDRQDPPLRPAVRVPGIVFVRIGGTVRKQLAVLAFVVVALAPMLARPRRPRPRPAAADAKSDLRIVVFNVLHGILCPPETNECQADDRVELLGRHLQDAKCPQVVALEEIGEPMYARISGAPWVQDCKYEVVWHGQPGPDHELVLTTLPVKSEQLTILAGNFRGAYRLVLQSKVAPVVLVVSHQQGDPGPDDPPEPCTTEVCPPPCSVSDSVPACQTLQAEQLATKGGPKGALRILSGDFNVTATSDRYRGLIANGWIDSHLAAKNAECEPCDRHELHERSRGPGDGRAARSDEQGIERIDFILVKSPKGCRVAFDRASDHDEDGLGTGLFAHEPVSDGPGGIAFVSDHTGTAADISCR